MSLGKKLLIVLLSGTLSIVAFSFFIGFAVLLDGFIQLEQEVVEEQFLRLDRALKYQFNDLAKTASDWEQLHVTEPLSMQSFQELKLQFIMRLNNDGKILQGGLYDEQQQNIRHLEIMPQIVQHLLRRYRRQAYALNHTNVLNTQTLASLHRQQGIVLLPQGPLLFVSRRLPNQDILMLGVYLRGERLRPLIEYRHETLELSLFTLEQADQLPATAAEAYQQLQAGESRVQQLNGQVLNAYGLLHDAFGKPVLLVQMRMLRDFYWRGRQHLSLLLGGTALGLVILLVWLWWTLHRLVLQRIARLDRTVERVAQTQDLSLRVPSDGPDELGRLASALNSMLARLDEAQQLRQHLQQENRELARQLIDFQEEERKSLARELHDESGQSLTAIQAYATGIRALANGDKAERIRQSAEEITQAARHMYDVIHSMMRRLHPSALDSLGLVAVLEETCQRWQEQQQNTSCTLDIDGDLQSLKPNQRIHVYRLVQEALTNIAKHAQARQVLIRLHLDEELGQLRVSICDDGIGMNTDALHHGLGLRSMRERVETLGGELRLESRLQRGLCVQVQLPLIQQENDETD